MAAETAGTDDERGWGSRSAWSPVPEHGDDAETLLESADQAMYRAKAGGEAVAVGDPLEPEIKVEKTRK